MADLKRIDNVLEVTPDEKLFTEAENYLENGVESPVEPRFAATVMLIRNSVLGDGAYRVTDDMMPEGQKAPRQPIEVFMLRRAKSMKFVPDAVVFPGGGIDKTDSDSRLAWAGPTPEYWADRMKCSVDVARRVLVGAAREVFEESGVLLAGLPDGQLLSDVSGTEWQDARDRLGRHEISFAEFLIERNLELRTDLMGLRSHWVTPVFEPRRYDTYFFSALIPAGQKPDGRTSEATIADWVTPQWALHEAANDTILLVPPTIYNLEELEKAMSTQYFIAERPEITRIMLEPVRKEDGSVVMQAFLS